MIRGKYLGKNDVKRFSALAAILCLVTAVQAPDAATQTATVDSGPASADQPTIGTPSAKQVEVPFVGCKSDGQMGPKPAPKAREPTQTVAAGVAGSLAYYASEDLGVLAPRGWYCAGLYGSNGDILIVSATPVRASALLRSNSGLKGPAIQLTIRSGETSGRFEVAEIAARLFPSKRDFVQRVIDEDIQPASDFPFGPYPADIVTRRSDADVEFVTPPHRSGMGTKSRLAEGGEPIYGLALMTDDNSVVLLDVRMPKALRHLAPAIVEVTHREYITN